MKKKKAPKLFKSYPEIISGFVAIFITGILLATLFPANLSLIWLSLALILFTISFCNISAKSKQVLLYTAALTASMFYGAVRYSPPVDFTDFLQLDQSTGILTGCYTGQSSIVGANRINYVFDSITYNSEEQQISIPGQVVCSTVTNREKLYPEEYYSMSGTMIVSSIDQPPHFQIEKFEGFDEENPSLLSIAKQLQATIKRGLSSVIKKEHAAIINGFILGDTSQISDKSLFVETGISHLLAISGQHIMIIVFVLASILHWFKVPPISRSILISIFLIFYATITVGSPSVWRALIMYICVATIMHIESAPSPIRPISIAAFILLLYNPSYISNAAFILSFTAVLAIIYLRQPIEYLFLKIHIPEAISRYLAVTFAANLGTTPMVAYLFGTVSLSALFVNPLVVWSFSFILPVAFFIAIVSLISVPLAVYLSPALSLMLDLLLSFLEFAKNIPGMYFYVGNLSGLLILIIYFLLLTGSAIFNRWQIKQLAASVKKKPSPIKIHRTSIPTEEKASIKINEKSSIKQVNITKIEEQPEELLPYERLFENPFIHDETISALDDLLNKLRRRPLNSSIKIEEVIPIKALPVDLQNIYYRLYDLDETVIKKDPVRIIEAHIYLLSLVGNEILNRINANLVPTITPNDLDISLKLQNRYLTTAVLSDLILRFELIQRITDPRMKELIHRGQNLHDRVQRLLDKMLKNETPELFAREHLKIRVEYLKWCWEFIQLDNNIKSENRNTQH